MNDNREAVPLRQDRNDPYKPSEMVAVCKGLTQVQARGVSTLRTGKWILAPPLIRKLSPINICL